MPRRANAANLPSKRRKKDADCTDKYLRYGEDPNKSWKPCKWKLTFDAPQPSTTFQEASKEDSRLAGWEIGKRRPAEYFPLMYDQHGYPVRCVECGMKWKTGKTSRKRHNDKGFVLDSNGKKVAICVIARQNEEKAQQKGNSAKRLKSNATQSAAKQPLQPSNVTPVSGRASQPASVPASGPVPEPASGPAPEPAPEPASGPSPEQQLLETDEEWEAICTLASILVDPDNASSGSPPRSSPRSENGSWNSLSEFVLAKEFGPANPGINLDPMCGL